MKASQVRPSISMSRIGQFDPESVRGMLIFWPFQMGCLFCKCLFPFNIKEIIAYLFIKCLRSNTIPWQYTNVSVMLKVVIKSLEFFLNELFVIKRAQTCHLLFKKPGCYHSISKTHIRDRIFKLNPIHVSVIYQIPWIWWIYSIQWKFSSIGKTPLFQLKDSIAWTKCFRRYGLERNFVYSL